MANGMKNKNIQIQVNNKHWIQWKEFSSESLLPLLGLTWLHLNWQQHYHHEVMRLFYKCVALTFYLIRQIGIWHSMFTTLCYYNSTSMNQTVSVCIFPLLNLKTRLTSADRLIPLRQIISYYYAILQCKKEASITIAIIVVGWVQVLSTCKQGH